MAKFEPGARPPAAAHPPAAAAENPLAPGDQRGDAVRSVLMEGQPQDLRVRHDREVRAP